MELRFVSAASSEALDMTEGVGWMELGLLARSALCAVGHGRSLLASLLEDRLRRLDLVRLERSNIKILGAAR